MTIHAQEPDGTTCSERANRSTVRAAASARLAVIARVEERHAAARLALREVDRHTEPARELTMATPTSGKNMSPRQGDHERGVHAARPHDSRTDGPRAGRTADAAEAAGDGSSGPAASPARSRHARSRIMRASRSCRGVEAGSPTSTSRIRPVIGQPVIDPPAPRGRRQRRASCFPPSSKRPLPSRT